MSVKYHKDRGYWYIDTGWPDGQRTRMRQPDQATANKINKKIEVACADEERIWRRLRKELRLDEGGCLPAFSKFADDLYLRNYVMTYNRSVRSKQSRLNILKRFFGNAPFDSINPQRVARFIAERKAAGASNATINRDIATLRHMFNWAVDQGYLDSNPIASIRKLEEVEWIGERPDESMIDKIFSHLNPRAVPVFTFLRETGCRKGEAISLKRSQLDLPRAQVVFHSNTKNGKSRQVPLTEAAITAISAMPRRWDLVFYHPDTIKKWTGDSVAEPWERAREAAGSGLRIHDLRHAFGIKLAEAGCPMHYISEVLGHHSIDFTRKHYARFSPDSASRAVLKVLAGRKN